MRRFWRSPFIFRISLRDRLASKASNCNSLGAACTSRKRWHCSTRFPFGFVEKSRRVDSTLEAVVYPAVQPADDICQDWALVSGELESYMRGRGNDLYAIRAYQNSDSVRHVDWKASAKRNALQVREFTREDQRQVLLVLDPFDPLETAATGADGDQSIRTRRIAVRQPGLAFLRNGLRAGIRHRRP